MIDLSEKMFYKVRFNIEHVNESNDLLWDVVMHIKRWQTRKWNKKGIENLPEKLQKWTHFKNGGRIFSEDADKSVYMESDFYVDDEKQCWACKIIEKNARHEGLAGRQWTTQVGLEQRSGVPALFTCILTYNDAAHYIGPTEPEPYPTIPILIKNILFDTSLRCFLGDDTIAATPKKILVGGWYDFWDVLKNPNRQLPCIYLSPVIETNSDEDSNKVYTALNPFKVAEILGGNALVFYADDIGFSDEMRNCCPVGYECFQGAIRIYYPQLVSSDRNDARRHRFFTANQINEIGADEFIKILRRVFAQDLRYYEDKDYVTLAYCQHLHKASARQKRIDALKQSHVNELSKIESDALELLEEQENKLTETETSLEAEKQECEKYRQENYKLKSQLNQFRDAASRLPGLEKAVMARNRYTSLPSTPEEVVSFFSATFGDRIVFTEDAIRSLKWCTLAAAELWNIFFNLATVMYDLLLENGMNPYTEFKNRTGIDCSRGEGSMTRNDKKLMQQFISRYEGVDVDIEPHITYPKESQSIHFGFLREKNLIVVGHCGEHLNNYSTRKHK